MHIALIARSSHAEGFPKSGHNLTSSPTVYVKDRGTLQKKTNDNDWSSQIKYKWISNNIMLLAHHENW